MAKYYFLICFLFCSVVGLKAQHSDAPENTRFYYNGMLDNTEHVQLNLQIDNYIVNGAFVIEATGDHYFIHGRLSGDKTGIGVWVYQGNQYIAAIEARVISDDKEFGKKLYGVYKPRKQEVQELVLKKIAEFANKSKLSNPTFNTII